MRHITARQREVLACICEMRRTTGVSPTIREIGERMGIGSTNGVGDHLRSLVRKGFLRHSFNTTRGLVPTTAGLEVLGLLDDLRVSELGNLGELVVAAKELSFTDVAALVAMARHLATRKAAA